MIRNRSFWILFFAFSFVLFQIALVGCGGGSSSSSVSTSTPPPTPPPTPTPPASGSEFFYAFSQSRQSPPVVSTLTPSTGALTPFIGATTPAYFSLNLEDFLPYPFTAVTPSGKFIYVATDKGIVSYFITGPDGQMTFTGGSPFGPSNTGSTGLVMDSLGRFLYVSYYYSTGVGINPLVYYIDQFTLDPNTGYAGYVSPNLKFTESTPLTSLSIQAADPGGNFMYAWGTASSSLDLFVYSIDPASGQLSETSGSPYAIRTPDISGTYNSSDQTMQVLASPSGDFVYALVAPLWFGQQVPAFTHDAYFYSFSVNRSTGALTPVPGSPFDLGNAVQILGPMYFMTANAAPITATLAPGGNFLYVPTSTTDTTFGPLQACSISVFAVDSSNGSINSTPVSTIGPVTGCLLSMDPSGKVLVANPPPYYGGDVSATLLSFTVDASTGALTPAVGSPFSVTPAPPASLGVEWYENESFWVKIP